MNARIIANGILKATAILVGVALFCLFIFKIRSVIAYIAIAAVVSLIGRPIVIFFRRRLKFKNTLAVIISMVLMVGIIVGVIWMFIPLLIEQGQNLSLLDIESLQLNIENLYREVVDYFSFNDIDIEKTIKESDLLSGLDFGAIPNFLNSLIGALGSFSIGFFSIVFIAFFFLKDSKLLEGGLMVLVSDSKEGRLKKSINTIKDLLSRYFVGLLLQIFILFVIYTIVLLILGIPNAVVIAFLCALLNLIPYIGPLVGGFLMLVLTMTSNLGQDFSSVILPKTSYVMIGFIIGGLLFGVVGMIVAVPSYTVIKVILKEFLSENKIVKSLTKSL